MLMTILTNTYVLDEETMGIVNVLTGVLGVYDDMDKAVEAWNESLRMIGVPENKADLYDTIGHAYIRLNEEGKYISDESEDDTVYMLELMSKTVKPNVTYRAVS